VFVADFLGVSNLLGAEAVGQDGAACTVRVGDRTLRAQEGATTARGEVKVMIRPERIVIEPHASSGEQRMPGIVERSVFQGGAYEVHIRVLGGELLRAMVPNDGGVSPSSLEAGAAVSLHLPADALRVLTPSEEPEIDDDQVEQAGAGAPPQPITPPPA
jgi:ABC-type Fe3+/spermidine/putrescine transport system ATPase subunit